MLKSNLKFVDVRDWDFLVCKKRGHDIVVDAPNVIHCLDKTRPHYSMLWLINEKLRERGYKPLLIISRAMINELQARDARSTLRRLYKAHCRGWVRIAPGREDSDCSILRAAEVIECEILSNDNFEFHDFDSIKTPVRKYRVKTGRRVVFPLLRGRG